MQNKNQFYNFALNVVDFKFTTIMKILKTLLTIVVLPVVICVLAVVIFKSVMVPVNFDHERGLREKVAIQRLKDIRSLEAAYKSVNGKFTASIDSLIDFYRTGKMSIIMQIGSSDDSAAVANTQLLKKKNKKITPEQMYELYLQGEKNLVFSISQEIFVKDTLFRSRENFVVDSLRYIPFSGSEKVQFDAVVKRVSGVNVPLFEAKMPFELLLKGMDKQLIINLKADRKAQDRYAGLMVGSVSSPNNNAGNWE